MEELKYKELIEYEFNSLGLIPRPHQYDIINEILTSYIDNGFKNVVLNAPTGSGKSLVAYVTTKCLSTIKNAVDKQSFILVHNNSLLKQYNREFKNNISYVNGSSNYRCKITSETADNCIYSHMVKKKDKDSFDKKNLYYCSNDCKYKLSRKYANKNQILLTNYSYYILSKLSTEFLEDRLLTVYDEAHTLNDVFVNHNSIVMSKEKLKHVLSDLDILNIPDVKKELTTVMDKIDTTTKKNYKNLIKVLYNNYIKIINKLNNYIECDDVELEEYKTFKTMLTRYENEYTKMDDFLSYEYDHSIQITNGRIIIKPIFINSMMNNIIGSEYNLFMSATIEENIFRETIDLDNTKFINVEPVFDPSHKEVFFFSMDYINYNYLNGSNSYKNKTKILDYIKDIIEAHNNENGMIHTNNFVITEFISEELKLLESKLNTKIFSQKTGEKFADTFNRYNRYDGNKILISPSAYEGIDLKDDLARFQIIIKAPYPDISDERNKYILEHNPNVYKMMTIYKIIQGMGRSTRSADDHSCVYCLDASIEDLFNDKDNIWKNEFSIIS